MKCVNDLKIEYQDVDRKSSQETIIDTRLSRYTNYQVSRISIIYPEIKEESSVEGKYPRNYKGFEKLSVKRWLVIFFKPDEWNLV